MMTCCTLDQRIEKLKPWQRRKEEKENKKH